MKLKTLLPKLEQWLWYLFLFCIPFQTRLIFARWQTLPDGGFSEWGGGFLYGTDILLIGLLVFGGLRFLRERQGLNIELADKILLGFLGVALLSITQSQFQPISWYQWIKLTEFVAFYFYIKYNYSRFSFEKSALILFFSGLFQSAVAIVQYVSQSSLSLRWLGESPLTPGAYGVASIIADGHTYLRAYGTLPHPNVLALFLLATLASALYLFFSSKYRWVIYGYPIMLYAFLLTYSRTLIGLAFLGTVVFFIIAFLRHKKDLLSHKKKIMIVIWLTLGTVIVFSALNWSPLIARLLLEQNDEAINLRLYYNKLAGNAGLARPILGSGIGTFVPNFITHVRHLPGNIYQPAHNIYLLIFSEIGGLGLLLFLAFIFFKLKVNIQKYKKLTLSQLACVSFLAILLCAALFDHYLWTIQQGRAVFWLVLAIIL